MIEDDNDFLIKSLETEVILVLGAAAVAVLATATVLIGGVVLAALALGGAAVGTGLVTAGAAKADRENGCARDTSDFVMQLVTGTAVSKLKAKKKYYVRVRTYKTVKIDGKNIKVYSSWSDVKTVTTKK